MDTFSIFEIQSLPYFKKQTAAGEYSAACPKCGGAPSPLKVAEGRANEPPDRFRYWESDGHFWCRACGLWGIVAERGGDRLSQAELKAVRDTITKDVLTERKALVCRLNLNDQAQGYWQALNGHTGLVSEWWGISPDTIDTFKVGYCDRAPLYPDSDSFTIPYLYPNKACVNIRHRLLQPPDSGKYRPQRAGLGVAFFNPQVLAEEWVVLVEGEMKVMALVQRGIPAFSIPGKSAFRACLQTSALYYPEGHNFFANVKKLHICLDPDALREARQIGLFVKDEFDVPEIRVVDPWEKPDDLMVKYGMSPGDFCRMLEYGEVIR